MVSATVRMLLITPQFLMYDRFPWYRRAVARLTSEQWSLVGTLCLLATALCGFVGSSWLFAALLVAHCVCDTNDGVIYRYVERGRWNGYGLYLDHLCDSIGAIGVAVGGYLLLGHGWLVAAGLVLFYLLAVHSWLYKIVQISLGQSEGADFWVVLQPGSRYWRLGPDDLAFVLCLIVLFEAIPLLIALNVTLAAVFVVKVSRAISFMRGACWQPQREVALDSPQSECADA